MYNRNPRIKKIEVKPANSFCTDLNNTMHSGAKMLKRDCITFFKAITDSCMKWDKRAARQNRIDAIKEQQAQKFKMS